MKRQILVRSLFFAGGAFMIVACADDEAPVTDGETRSSGSDGDSGNQGETGDGDGGTGDEGKNDGAEGDAEDSTSAGGTGGNAESGGETESGASDGAPTDDSTSTSGQGDDGSTDTGEDTSDSSEPGYGNCIGDAGASACLGSEECLVDDPNLPAWGFCSRTECSNANQCPMAPMGGSPTVVCSDVDGDEQSECALSCADGEVCPEDMECLNDGVCAFTRDLVSDFDGMFCIDFAMPLPECSFDLDESSAFSGRLECGPVADDFVWDLFLLNLQQGDCVSVWADNVGASGPAGTESGDLLLVVQNTATNDWVSLDDEADCSDPTFGGTACPRGSFTVGDSGVHELGVAQWGGDGCPNPSPYTLSVSINGVALDLAGIGLSESDYPLSCGF